MCGSARRLGRVTGFVPLLRVLIHPRLLTAVHGPPYPDRQSAL